MAAKNSRKACSSPAASSQPDAARRGSGSDRHRQPAALVGLAPAGCPERHAAGRPQAQRGEHSGKAVGRLGRGDRLVRRGVALEHAQERRCAVALLGEDGVVRCVEGIAAHDREAVAQLEPVDLHPGAAQGRHNTGAHGVAVERDLDLAVDPLEALLGESEAGGVLVEPLEHRLEGGLGLLAAQPVHAQPGGSPGSELMAGLRTGRQLAQSRPALREERAGAGLVPVEGRAAAATLVYDVEFDLGAGLLVVCEKRGGLQREVPQRVVESTVTHAARFRRAAEVSCRALAPALCGWQYERVLAARIPRARARSALGRSCSWSTRPALGPAR